MSVEFSNAYQDILFENLVSIIKQNFIFQTQVKLAEDTGKRATEIQAKYDELLKLYEMAKSQATEATNLKVSLNESAVIHEENNRLQTALNESMVKQTVLQQKIQVKDTEIASLKEYIEKLESIAALSKLKKLNPEKFASDEKPVEQSAPNLFALKVNDGSSF